MIVIKFLLLTSFLFLSPVQGSEHYLNYGDDPGSNYYWKYGNQVGSSYYWQYGNKAGSSHFWTYGTKIGSKHFWDYGKEAGSYHFWKYGKEAGSKHYWEYGNGPGSKHFWKYGNTASFAPFFVSLCKGNVLDIEPCQFINAPTINSSLDALENLQNLLNAPVNNHPSHINKSEGHKEIRDVIRGRERGHGATQQ